jgi:hypothetical protein
MTDNKVIHACSKCSKIYKNIASLQKHTEKCTVETVTATSVPAPTTALPKPSTASTASQSKPAATTALPKPATTTTALPKQSTPIAVTASNGPKVNENTYDVNMTFVEGNKVQVDIKKQPQPVQVSSDSDSDEESGEKVLKDILRPKVSNTYQDEIDKLENLINMFKTLPISDDPNKKDHTIEQLKKTVTILMTQSRNLIKEMKQMSRRNSYYRNNIMLSAFILDNCRKDVPETDEEFENMFS